MVEHPIEVTSYRPTCEVIELTERSNLLFTGCPPAVEPYEVPPYGIIWGYPYLEPPQRPAVLAPPGDYRAQIYHMVHCPEDPVGDRFPGLDDLVSHMGQQGLKFYKSPTVSMESGPDGIIAADDVVVIKINYQWDQRGGTNTDVLRGLIRRVVDHPDTFTGEVAVCENAQFASTSNFDRPLNNAEDHSLSPHDVVMHFQALGYPVCHFDWTVVFSVTAFHDDGYHAITHLARESSRTDVCNRCNLVAIWTFHVTSV